MPIFPELRPLLLEACEHAADGEANVITRWRTSAVNLRTGFERIITRAGLTPWPRLWQNLRASRATDLIDSFPSHVSAAWLGHTDAVADRHYRQVTPAHVAAAVAGKPKDLNSAMDSNTALDRATHIPTQHIPPIAHIGQKRLGADIQNHWFFSQMPPRAKRCRRRDGR